MVKNLSLFSFKFCKLFFGQGQFLFIFVYVFLLHWVSVAARRLSPAVASGGYSSCSTRTSHCSGFSCGAQALRARGLGQHAGSAAAALGSRAQTL